MTKAQVSARTEYRSHDSEMLTLEIDEHGMLEESLASEEQNGSNNAEILREFVNELNQDDVSLKASRMGTQTRANVILQWYLSSGEERTLTSQFSFDAMLREALAGAIKTRATYKSQCAALSVQGECSLIVIIDERQQFIVDNGAQIVPFLEQKTRTKPRRVVEFQKKLEAEIKLLKQACDDLAADSQKGLPLADSFSEFSRASRLLSKTVIEKLIPESFEGKIVDGKSTEDLDEKIEHAKRIRNWLAPWNFALKEPVSGNLVKLVGITTASKMGSYRLYPLGQTQQAKRVSNWEHVRQILESPQLEEATDVIHRRNPQFGR